MAEENEYLLAFDDPDFDRTGTTFMVDDWISHTPKDILARNFGKHSRSSPYHGQLIARVGVPASVFNTVPSPNPYISNATVKQENVASPYGKLEGNGSYVYKASKIAATKAAGGGGTIKIVDSRNFPISTTIAAAIVTLEPGALRELHWHPNVRSPLPL